MSTERAYLKFHTHQSLETKCIQRGSPYRVVVAIGGIRSGKTLVIARWMIDRGKWDTAQYHGLFANTGPQLQSAVLGEVLPWLELAGIDWWWNKRPPKAWLENWRRNGIKTPPRLPKYTNILILSTGLHIYCGSMSNKSYRQVKGMKFGSIVIEEITAGATEEGLRYLFERCNCGLGPVRCRELHHHVKVIHGNTPDDDLHWIYGWLAKRARQAAKSAGLQIPTDDDDYTLLYRGVGDSIFIPSRTIDNVENLPAEFIDDMTSTVDEETAKKVLWGDMARRRKGRAYNAFSHLNQLETIQYDPDRTLYVSLDFNKNPAVALYVQPMNPGEYPSENDRPGIQHVGAFGEVFNIGGIDVEGLCTFLLSGEAGSDGSLPPEFRGLRAHRTKVMFFGDATALYERMAGNEWQIVDKIMKRELGDRYVRRVEEKRNPEIAVGVHAVNAKLCSAGGVRSFWVHPRVRNLIQDFLTNAWDKDGKKILKYGERAGRDLFRRAHIGDTARYLLATLFPLGVDLDPRGNTPKVIRRTRREETPSHI